MHSVSYGDQTISYIVQDCPDSKSHYISVSRDEGVVLKGPRLPTGQADRLVLKKARWILEKLEIVRAIDTGAIVTGSRIAYLGMHYYTEVVFNPLLTKAQVDFNYSRFRIQTNPTVGSQAAIQQALNVFFRVKAKEKLTTRVQQWATKTGLSYRELKFRKLSKRWGSCTHTNSIILNPDLIKLPYSLIDYVIVHELCHTKVKSHSKEFWAEVSRHMSNWKEFDDRVSKYII
ncbi:SprT family zinc-dependent metalloprotease [Larkinella ripae]